MPKPVAVVVGVGPGLGMSLARRFARGGMEVVACARNPAKVEALARDIPGVRLEACDATKPADVARVFAQVGKTHGAPALVAFNAGAYERGGILEIKPEDFERCWRVGCFGGFLVGQAAARLMAEKAEGTILFTGATASLRGGAGFANLAVPKFGLRALAQSMARELGPRGIHVAHVIIDGQIASDSRRDMAAQRGPLSLLSPDSIAETYWQLHAQPRDAWTHELDLRPWVEKF
ncbi:MAG TPA: SDR family NAD(P)-dependent oxidoreductase [Usitatibacter sp.]|nr:SDR family NAD(P)-dependent oxidoreductase [Usitatibacter sp.]